MKSIKNLILYRDFEHEKLFHDLTWVMENFKDGYYNREDIGALFYECVNRLVKLAADYGFEGNLWQSFVAFLLVNNENPYSCACELREGASGSINDIAMHDFAIIRAYFNFDLSEAGRYFGVECMDSIQEAVDRENSPEEEGGEPCNLMEYFYGSDSIKEKVESAVVSVESEEDIL